MRLSILVSTRKRLLLLILGAFVTMLFVAMLMGLFFEPNQTTASLLQGEEFFRLRPKRHWRAIVAKDMENGQLSDATLKQFRHPWARPVVMQLSHDSDWKIRWASILLLTRCAGIREQVQAFIRLLRDPEWPVRHLAIETLGNLRRESLAALPELSRLAASEDVDEKTAARYALWSIDKKSALSAEKWARYESQEWEFSIMLPGPVEEKQSTNQFNKANIHGFWAWSGHAALSISVTEPIPPADIPLDERYENAAKLVAEKFQGTIIRNVPVSQLGQTGRDQLIYVNRERVFMHSRLFFLKDRVYQANVTYLKDKLHPDCIANCLDSVEITLAADE